MTTGTTSTVFLHPVGLDGRTWQFMQFSNAEFIDFPGHGVSPPTPVLTLQSLADYVCQQVKGNFHLVGVSLGGMVAQHITIRHPERVKSLAIACVGAATSPKALQERADEVERVGMKGILSSSLSRWFTAEALRTEGHVGVQYARDRLLADDASIFASYWRTMAKHDVVSSLTSIAVPTTVIAGSDDASVPVAVMRDMAARISGSRMQVVDGPHMLQLECPEAFEDVVKSHIQWAEASS